MVKIGKRRVNSKLDKMDEIQGDFRIRGAFFPFKGNLTRPQAARQPGERKDSPQPRFSTAAFPAKIGNGKNFGKLFSLPHPIGYP
jgi:hypothetical protein